MPTSPPLHIVVLAAGASRRFGSPKQLFPVRGRPMLSRTIQLATRVAGRSVTVVLGAHESQLSELVRTSGATIVVNRHWSEGLASSIRAGILSLPADCAGAMLMLGDQFALRRVDLQRLANAWRRAPSCTVAAQYAGVLGAPAIFPRARFGQLAALRGDHGAQSLLRDPADGVVPVPMEKAALDLDLPV